MNQPELQTNDPDADQQQLVAYLDGELTADESRRLEQRLSQDPEFRRTLQRLEQAWDLLDELPRAEAGSTFTQSTLEMVALTTDQDAEQAIDRLEHKRRWLWIATSVGAVVCLGLGYSLVDRLISRPDRQLMRDMPVIERVDDYQLVDSVDFLRQLQEEGLFTVDDSVDVDVEGSVEGNDVP